MVVELLVFVLDARHGLFEVGDAQLRDLLFADHPREREAADVVHGDAVRELIGDQLGGGMRQVHLATLREPADPGRPAHRRAVVVALVLLRLTGVHAGTHREADALGELLLGERPLEGDGGSGGIGRPRERGERAVTLALRARHPAAVRLGDLGRQLVMARDHLRHRRGVRLPEGSGPFDVGEHERDDAGGQRDLPRALQPLDELRRGGRPSGRVRVEGAAQHPIESLGELRGDALPLDRRVGLRLVPGEQPRDRAREHPHVVGNRRGGGVAERGGAEHEHRPSLRR